jgi:hypothetical protein
MEIRETLCGLQMKDKISRTTTRLYGHSSRESNLIIIHLISRIWMRRVKKRGISFLFLHACRCLHYSSMKTSFSLLHSVCFSSSSRTDAVKIAGMMKTINTTAIKTLFFFFFFFFQILDGEIEETQWKKRGEEEKNGNKPSGSNDPFGSDDEMRWIPPTWACLCM